MSNKGGKARFAPGGREYEKRKAQNKRRGPGRKVEDDKNAERKKKEEDEDSEEGEESEGNEEGSENEEEGGATEQKKEKKKKKKMMMKKRVVIVVRKKRVMTGLGRRNLAGLPNLKEFKVSSKLQTQIESRRPTLRLVKLLT